MKSEVVCEYCNKVFLKENREINRSNKRGMKHYCNNICSGHDHKEHLGEYLGNPDPRFWKLGGRKKDEFSDFKFYARKARARNKKNKWEEIDFDAKDLKEIWEQQDGICPLTGWKLEHYGPDKTQMPNTASLDRITPLKPYAKNNIRFVAFMANICKNVFTDEQVIDFSRAVSETRSTN